MSHVFHPGHHALHGITVVLETHGAETFVGRFDSEDTEGVHMLDVGVHDGGAAVSKEEYIRRSAKFGIRADRKHLVVPKDAVARITPLGELGG
ncbi:MAG: hypothetical protein H0T68_03235 [Gemmatimonadales bacterium]|nr:hypothetical protein [Gemmatimonadales bacterium]MBA3555531.1 hypothetical protein [Gemmatimonadales bacterium]